MAVHALSLSGLILSYVRSPPIFLGVGMQLNRKRKKKSEIEAEKEIIT